MLVEHSTYKTPTIQVAQVYKPKKLPSITSNLEIRNQTTTSNPASQKITKHLKGNRKIILIGDSHVRECISKLQDKLQDPYKVIGYVKHGVGVIIASEMVQKEMSSPTKEDILIFWEQTNDTAFNNSTR